MISKLVYFTIERAYRYANAIHQRRSNARALAAFWQKYSESGVRAVSYYQGKELKPMSQIRAEIGDLYCSGKAGSTPDEVFNTYMLFGLDRASENVRDYLFGSEFLDLVAKHRPSYALMLNNKIFTLVYLAARGIPVSEILGQVDDDGVFQSIDGSCTANFHDWMAARRAPVFCKQPDGYEGTSCFLLERRGDRYLMNGKECKAEDLNMLTPQLQIETVVEQHPDMAAIYPGSVNTCRIVTVSIRGKVRFFSGYALFGCNGAHVSNGCSGGLFVPFDEKGQLGKCGVRELVWGGGSFERHPDTGVAFAGCSIPCFSDVMRLAFRAHETMPSIRSVGWDIAVTPTGPIIIEGNQGWGPLGHFALYGGRRQLFERILG